MAKLGTDSYLAKFDKYGDGKTKKHKEKDKGCAKKNKKAKKNKSGNAKALKALRGELDERFNACADSIGLLREEFARIAAEHAEFQTKVSEVSELQTDIEGLKKTCAELERQTKTIGKTQKALKKDLDAATAAPFSPIE